MSKDSKKNSNAEKKNSLWVWILVAVIVVALAVLLFLHPWNSGGADEDNTPLSTDAVAQTGTVESNSILGEADQAAAEASTEEQQSVAIEDATGLIESVRVTDTIDTEEGKEAVYSVHLNANAAWGSDSETDKQTALKVLKEVIDQSREDGYASCDMYVYQANNCMAFMWFEFNPQYLSLFDAQGNGGDTIVFTEEEVHALGVTIPDFYSNN